MFDGVLRGRRCLCEVVSETLFCLSDAVCEGVGNIVCCECSFGVGVPDVGAGGAGPVVSSWAMRAVWLRGAGCDEYVECEECCDEKYVLSRVHVC